MEKVSRNDPCPCGSGKKFKKCCADKVVEKKFSAEVLTRDPLAKANRISSSFFQSKMAPSQTEAATHPEEKDVVM